MVAQVVTSCYGMCRPVDGLPVEVIWATRNEHVLKGYARVSPLRDDSRLEDDGNAGFCREVVAKSASNVFWNEGLTDIYCCSWTERGGSTYLAIANYWR